MESQKKNKFSKYIPGMIMVAYMVGTIGFSLADSKFLVPNLLITLVTVMYIYHLRSGNKSLGGIKIDNTFLIPVFMTFVFIAYLSLSSSDSDTVYKVSEESQVLECEETGKYTDSSGEKKDCELMEKRETFWKSKKAITIYIIASGCFFVLYEIFSKTGIKEAGARVLTLVFTFIILFLIASILLNIGQNSDDQSKSSELELKDIRSNYIFKGGIGGFWDLIDIEKNKLCFIKLEFKSQQVQTTRDSKNIVIDGNDNLILNITELWTFSKELKNKNPNWVLEKIEENN